MNLDVDLEQFGRELPLWAVRGILCAAPSALWAVIGEFKQPAELAAMVLGTGLYIAGFAWFSAWPVMAANAARRQLVRALKMSAWIKPAMVVGLGAAGMVFSGRWQDGGAWFCGMFPDMFCGFGSVSLVSWLAGASDLGLAHLHSFGWTTLTTLVQGALISGLIVILAAGVLAWWWVWAWLKPQLMVSPARLMG